MEPTTTEAVQNVFSNGVVTSLLNAGLFIAAIASLYKKIGQLIEQNFALSREHSKILEGVITENTKAMQTVAVVITDCKK